MEKVLIGLLGVVLGAILTVAREFWNNRRTKKERAEYLAIRVVCTLERFMDGCVAIAGDDGEMHGRDLEGIIHLNTTLPEIDIDSLDVDWRCLPFDLMYEILNFPTLVNESNGIIDSVFEHMAIPPDYEEGIDERRYQYSKLGNMANLISTKLREKYNMPPKVYERWNPADYLNETKEKIEKQISDRKSRKEWT